MNVYLIWVSDVEVTKIQNFKKINKMETYDVTQMEELEIEGTCVCVEK